MQLSKTGYYADFGIYATILGVMIPASLIVGDWTERGEWLAAFGCGLVTWTLLEYLLHRYAFHRMPFISPLHAAHHVAPRALIGTPTWVTFTIFSLLVFLPSWRIASLNVASGLASGVMLGFFWYGLLHHAIHHRRPRVVASRVKTASRRHFRHHGLGMEGNYGVTTSLWDAVFGTQVPDERPSRMASRLGRTPVAGQPPGQRLSSSRG